MAVHVDEVHTDVTRSSSIGGQPSDHSARERLGAAEDWWQQSRCLTERLASRVRAEGFDD